MKSLVLASLLGTAAGAFAVPVFTGPIHFQVTKPFSLFGWLPTGPNPVSVTLGIAPGDFVLTDVMVGQTSLYNVLVTVNGNPVFNCGTSLGYFQGDTHLSSGVYIPSGATIGVQAMNGSYVTPVTLVGYLLQ